MRPAHALPRYLDPEWSVYAVDLLRIVQNRPIESLAEIVRLAYKQVRSVAGHAVPLAFVGFCFGAQTAFEMACQRAANDGQVSLVCAVDSPASWEEPPIFLHVKNGILNFPQWIRWNYASPNFCREVLRKLGRRLPKPLRPKDRRRSSVPEPILNRTFEAVLSYRPAPYAGPVKVFRVEDRQLFAPREPTMGWAAVTDRPIDVSTLSGSHVTCLDQNHIEGNVSRIARAINEFHRGLER